MDSGTTPGEARRRRIRATLCGLLLIPLLTSGCASTPSSASPFPVPSTGSETDRAVCEEFARRAASAVRRKSASEAFGDATAEALAAAGEVGHPALTFFFLGLAPMVGAYQAVSTARDTQRMRARAYHEAMETCLKPPLLAQAPDATPRELSESLVALAERYRIQGNYAMAGLLYQRAVTIQEQALGPDQPDLAAILEVFAAVLARLDKEDEAEALVTRYQAIREHHRQIPQPAEDHQESRP